MLIRILFIEMNIFSIKHMNKEMQKSRLLILFLFLFQNYAIAQEKKDYEPVPINNIVGNSIDKTEKIKYKLFPEISLEDFDYAQYLITDDGVILRIYKFDSSYRDIPRSFEEYSQDVEKTVIHQNREFIEPRLNYKKLIVKLHDRYSNKTIRLKKRKTIYYKLKGSYTGLRKMKIKNIIIQDEPMLVVKDIIGEQVLIPLSEISYITRMQPATRISINVIGGLYAATGLVAIIQDKENFLLGSAFIIFGSAQLLVKSKKFFITKSRVEVIYK